MKRFLLVPLAALLLASHAFADTETVNGITWTYTVSDGAASVGGGSSSSTAIPKTTTGAITIPTTLGGYPVTIIERSAFYNCRGLTSVTIGNGVKSIEDSAFGNCSSLKSVTIPNSVTSIWNDVFGSCESLTSVTIPASVTSIRASAFHGCGELMSFSVDADNPNYSSVGGMLLSKDAHELIAGINGVVIIPDSVTSIGDFAFDGRYGLTSVTIPDSVTSIGGWAFHLCNGLTSVTIPDSVTSIGRYAFDNCHYLASVTIPSSVTSIGENVFSSCIGLASVTIPDSVTSIGEYAFRGCRGLTSVTIPDSVTSIGDYAFRGCSGLTSVTIPESVTSIGRYAFEGCSGLASVTVKGDVPSGVATIPWASVERVYYSLAYAKNWMPVFEQYGIEEVIPIELMEYEICTETVAGVTWRYHLGDGGAVVCSGQWGGAAAPIAEGETLAVPAMLGGRPVVEIGIAAFAGEAGLAGISLPSTVTNIADYAFYGCNALSSITIPAAVQGIGNYAFTYCNRLASVSFTEPSALATIGDAAFRGCYRMDEASFFLPASVTSIGKDALQFALPRTLSGSVSGTLKPGAVYVVSNSVTVASGATLTIPGGTILKFNPGCSLTVNGTLDARGTRAQPIVFTSLKDDEHGGDTNGDGDKTYAQAGDWHQITGNGTVTLEHCKVLWCSAQNNQGALYPNGGTWTFDNSIVAHCEYDCMRSYGGTFTARNSTFMDSSMGAAPSSGTARFDNCVFYDLTTAVRWGNGTFNNCIFAKITQDIIDTKFYSSTLSSKFSHCCFWNPESTGDHAAAKVGQNGNIWADPLFLDPDAGDFRIAATSPCVDAGDVSVAPELDFYGQPRTTVRPAPTGTPDTLGRHADIGLHEYHPDNAPGPYDLAAVAVSSSAANAAPGGTLAVSWTVRNAGKRVVPDAWHDALALVNVATGRAYALGEPLNEGALAVGASRESSAPFVMPVVPAGDYRLRLSVNSRRADVAEGASTGNNAVLSEGVVTVALAATPSADGATGSVAPGASSVTAFSIPAGTGDLLLRVSAPAGCSSLSGRCGLGFLPVEGGSGTALVFADGEAWLSVPAGTETVYLVLENAGAASASFAADFRAGSLSVAGVSPTTLPASGMVTLQITGAGFTDGCEAFLSRAADSIRLQSMAVDSAGRLSATVDCAALTAGATYALRVTKGAEAKTLANAVSVSTAPGAGKFWAKLDVPESVREGRLVSTCFIEYGNSGTADVLSPVLQVAMDGNGTLGYIGGLSGQKTLQFVAAGGEGSAGVLRPGESRRIRFALRAGSRNVLSLHSSVGSDYAPAPWTSAADYHADLSAAAARIGLRGQDATDYALVLDLAKAMRNGEPTSAIFGRVVDEEGSGVEGFSFSLTNTSHTVWIVTKGDGSFCSTNLAAGTYFATGLAAGFGDVAVDGGDDFAMGDLTIANAVNFAVTVEDAVGDVVVAAIDQRSGATVPTEVGVNGRAEFRGLADGIYAVEAYDTNGIRRAASTMVIGGRGDDVSLSFRAGTSSLNVGVSGLGSPADCFAVLFRDGVLEQAENLDGNGALTLEGLMPGDYFVLVGREGAEEVLCANVVIEEGGSGEISLDATGDLTAPASASANSLSGRRRAAISLFPTSSVEENCEILLKEAGEVLATPVLPPAGIYDCQHNREAYATKKAEFDKEKLNLFKFSIAVGQYRSAKYKKWMAVSKLPIIAAQTIATVYFKGLGGGAISHGIELIAKGISGEDIDEAFLSDTADLIVGSAQELGHDVGVWGDRLSVIGELKTILSVATGLKDADRQLRAQFAKEEWLEGEYRKFQSEMFAFEFRVTHSPFPDGINGVYTHQCDEYTITETLPTIETVRPSVPQSCDPNEMAGPEGLGADRALLPGDTYEWTVYFENQTNATAAASEVRVSAQLSDQLDWSTFAMVAVSFGDQTDIGLAGKANGTSECAVPGTNYTVRSEVALDAGTGAVSWYLRIVDPAGDEEGYPLDTRGGFLPPNDPATHCGEGSITYSARVRADATPGAGIDASAIIKFDNNPDIPTDPSWRNKVATVYKPTIDLGGGTSASISLVVGQPYGKLPTPKAKAGHTFGGWYTGPNGTGRKVTAESIVQAGDSGLHAYWIKNAPTTYKVVFNANGGKGTMTAQTVARNVNAKLAANRFTRSGYVFLGWATSKGGAVAYANGAAVKNLAAAGKTATLYAQWAKKSYKVQFVANGGKGKMAAQKMTYGKAKKLSANKFKRKGYVFKGWAKSKANAKKGTVAYKNKKSVKNLVTNGKTVKLYAVWKKK